MFSEKQQSLTRQRFAVPSLNVGMPWGKYRIVRAPARLVMLPAGLPATGHQFGEGDVKLSIRVIGIVRDNLLVGGDGIERPVLRLQRHAKIEQCLGVGGMHFKHRAAGRLRGGRMVLFEVKFGQIDTGHRMPGLFLQNQFEALTGEFGLAKFLQRQPQINEGIDVVEIEIDCPFVRLGRREVVALVLCHLAKVEMRRRQLRVERCSCTKRRAGGRRLAKRIMRVAEVEVIIGTSRV